MGNRLKKESVQGTEIYHYNVKNQLTHLQSGADTLRYLYDRQGNLFYNPAVGRFLQEDTYRGDGLNLYAYCANNRVIYYDPSGYGLCPNGKTYPAKKEELVPDMPPGPNGTMISQEYDQLVYGGFYTDKAYNRMRFEAQYIPGIDNNSLEYKAMFEGIPVPHGNGTIYYFYDTGQVIGFDGLISHLKMLKMWHFSCKPVLRARI